MWNYTSTYIEEGVCCFEKEDISTCIRLHRRVTISLCIPWLSQQIMNVS